MQVVLNTSLETSLFAAERGDRPPSLDWWHIKTELCLADFSNKSQAPSYVRAE